MKAQLFATAQVQKGQDMLLVSLESVSDEVQLTGAVCGAWRFPVRS
jgi:hypothetical protein